jgi:Transposase DDE domain
VVYRLLAPGSEWRLHREWYQRSALADLLGTDAVIDSHALYECHDRLLAHRAALFEHLIDRWRDLFNASFDVLLYDLTSTYFEIDPPLDEHDKRRFGYSRVHRPDCVQVVIALVITPQGLPLAYEVLAGNTADNTTLKEFLGRIERQHGRARRIWLMDRGIPTEEVLAQMRASDPPVQYLVGTPKGRLTALERALLAKPWQMARPEVRVKLLAADQELYVFAESRDRIAKERGMRQRQLKWLWARLKQLASMRHLTREALLMKLGAAQSTAPAAWRLVSVELALQGASFGFRLNRKKLREVRRREGRYLLRTARSSAAAPAAPTARPAYEVLPSAFLETSSSPVAPRHRLSTASLAVRRRVGQYPQVGSHGNVLARFDPEGKQESYHQGRGGGRSCASISAQRCPAWPTRGLT